MSIGNEIIWELDEPTLFIAGRLKANFKISLADAIIAAIARAKNAILVHKDPEYEELHSEMKLHGLKPVVSCRLA